MSVLLRETSCAGPRSSPWQPPSPNRISPHAASRYKYDDRKIFAIFEIPICALGRRTTDVSFRVPARRSNRALLARDFPRRTNPPGAIVRDEGRISATEIPLLFRNHRNLAARSTERACLSLSLLFSTLFAHTTTPVSSATAPFLPTCVITP